MIAYCPTCANMLLVEYDGVGDLRYFCQTCPYIYKIDRKLSKKVPLKRKEKDDVLGGDEEWKNVAQTEATCPECNNHKAYYQELQTRSADEPATLFFKCVKCGHQWREN